MRNPHIPHIRLHKLKLVTPEQHTKGKIQLGPRQIDPKTRPRPASKRHHEALKRDFGLAHERIIEPAFGHEIVGIGKNLFVVGYIGDAHAHTCVAGNDPLAVRHRFAARTWIAGTETVAEACGFEDAGFEVGHLFQGVELEGRTVRKGSDEVCVKALVNAWCVDDVECCYGEGESGCFDASADDDLGFFGEAGGGFIGLGELGGEDFVEDCCFCVVGFQGFAGEGAGDEGALVLGRC
jgi:hypothetical protein